MRDAELVDVAVEGIGDAAHACAWTRKSWVVIWIARPNQVAVHALQPVTRQVAETKGVRRYPMRKVTTPVPVEGVWRVARFP